MGEAGQVLMQAATSHLQPTIAQRKCGLVLPDHLIFFFPEKAEL